MEYTHVFTPLKVGNLTIRNRIEVSPAEPFLTTKDGLITDEFIRFTAAFAKGGAGIVTVGDSPVSQEYADKNKYVVNLSDPFVVHGLVKLTDAIHRYGAVASIELNLRAEYDLEKLTKEELYKIMDDFADAADRCKRGGFDMVMLHCGHGHVVANFFSPQYNHRTDEYGCDTLENKCRFASELIDRVREKIGSMPIEIRMSGDELTEGGVGVDDAVEIAKYLQSKVDMVHVSAGNLYDLRTMPFMIQSTYVPMATNVRFAERFKKELDIPVVTVGSFTMELAEQALREGKADMVAMIRPFIADSELVNKAKDGKDDEIRPCIRCCNCTGDDPHGCPKPLRCSVNAVSGRNMEFDPLPKTEHPKNVLIIGGGCAGMEAAMRLSERGHHPTIWEKSDRLGGNLIPAGDNVLKFNIKSYREWAVHMVEKDPNIQIYLGKEGTKKEIQKFQPDALILALGSKPFVPDIPGIHGQNVVLAEDVDTGSVSCGKKVVVAGAGLTGTETAVSLAMEGHDVTIIDMLTLSEIDSKGNASLVNTAMLRAMMGQQGVKVLEQVKLLEISPEKVICQNSEGKCLELPCDTVVLSMGMRARTTEELTGIVKDTYVVGDCKAVGNITSSVRDAFYAAVNIE